MLTGEIKKPDDIPEGDLRRMLPIFNKENFHHNLELVSELEKTAKQKNCTPAQLAINWAKQLSKKDGSYPEIIPIPGATKEERVLENAKEITLSNDELVEIDSILKKFEVKGDRYGGPAKSHMEG
jgi:pyridoxine 4-dehydrogenase